MYKLPGFFIGSFTIFFLYFGNIGNVNIIQTSGNLCIINVTQSYLICLDSGNFLVESIFVVQQFVFSLIFNAFRKILALFVNDVNTAFPRNTIRSVGLQYDKKYIQCVILNFEMSILRSFSHFHRKLT